MLPVSCHDWVVSTLLTKGANTALPNPAEADGARYQVVVRWSDPGSSGEVDVFALLLGANGKVRGDEDLVFYNAPSGADGAVRLIGERSGEDGDYEARIAVDLDAVPADVSAIAVASSFDGEPGAGFGVLADVTLMIEDAAGSDVVRFAIDGASAETAFVFGELYRRNETWRFRAIGQGWHSGLAGLATDYGVSVEEPGVSSAEEPIEETAVGEAVVEESLDVHGEPVAETAVVVGAEGGSATPRAGAQKARPRGVRTTKKRVSSATLPPPALAGDETWTPARLFSVSGNGSADEQEKRATSALLATMVAVREFGRALVSRFGGPGGSIETYLETPFPLGDRTVYPDGVLRVARGGRIWTALLETKTGSNSLRRDQVENYLDVAKEQGFDVVVTLSNDIAALGGDHPVGVDRTKFKRVTLHHISWSEVLHEAQMQLAHRGLDDRLQAWMLAELVRYLEHPKSGAAAFEDMGASWVPVREAVGTGTLRPGDRKAAAVAASWEKLVRHLCLRLTSQLGVPAVPVMPRRLAQDPLARSAEATARLATEGSLAATLRIPNAVSPVSVVADLRTGMVRTSIELAAPREGGASRRVNWLLRQLRDAPDALIVEVGFARREETSCEQLKDLRDSNAALLPDPTADVRSFRLTLLTPMGTKRSGLRGGFIPSVNAAIDNFYAQVVQSLRSWPPAAPKLPAEVAESSEEVLESLEVAPEPSPG